MPLTWRLLTDSKALGRAGFGIEGGQTSEFYVPDARPTVDELHAFLLETLGDVEIDADAHKLKRWLPKAHPMWPWLFASKIEFQGVGFVDEEGETAELVPADPLLEAAPITPDHYQHVRVIAQVWFTPRPYSLLSDAQIVPLYLPYRDIDGNVISDWDSGEGYRFAYPEIEPAPQLISAQHGQLVYRTASQVRPPHGNTFSGFPTVMMPDGAFRVIWQQVPYRLLFDDNHPMNTLAGRINQMPFFGRRPGSLLYLGPRARPYTPVVPLYSDDVLSHAFSSEKLCDITFLFQYTSRRGADLPVPANPNWIADGWNLQPNYITRQFHYVTSPGTVAGSGPGSGSGSGDDNPALWYPQFLSAPMQLLFRCP